jgi:alpha-L-rhamnosidase
MGSISPPKKGTSSMLNIMKALILPIILLMQLAISPRTSAQSLAAYDLTCDHKINPIGIAPGEARLSWKMRGDGRNVMQSAYSVRVAKSDKFGARDIVWESGKVNSDASVLIPYQGDLKAGTRYYWQVKVWDNQKRESRWGAPAFFETGLGESDWKAKWVYPVHDTSQHIPALMIRKQFDQSKTIASARVYISSLGIYELTINGKRVGEEVLTPGWTAYDERIQYQAYDVTPLLVKGPNAIGVMLGSGWFRSNLGWEGNWGLWGKQLGLICQMNVKYSDGSEEVIGTDDTWKSFNDGPVRMTGIYDGENYDARKEIPGWNTASFNDSQWTAVGTGEAPKGKLVATETVPVKRIQEIKPIKIIKTPKGTLVIDFGQNLVGWVKVTVKENPGKTIVIRHAEVLDKFGEFYTDNLRGAKATMTYTTKGGSAETYEPKFTFFGFRFAAVDGVTGELDPANFTAVVVHSDMKPAGTFECSNDLVNQLQKNIQWGQKGNFVDVPTDCPQRDERLGWTGDAQVFARTAAYNMNVAAFFGKWLKDLAADQVDDGSVPFVIPNVLGDGAGGSTGWADASTIIPWEMYQVYGDKKFLEDQYPSMKAWVGYMESKSKNDLWNTTWHFGDWLFYIPFDDRDGRAAVTDKHLISQCFWAHSTQLLINAAKVLGKSDDVQHHTGRLQQIKDAFVKEYVTPSGRLVSGTQTAYVLALHFDMLPENLRIQAAQRLADNVKSYENHLTTGFLGTPYLCHVLSRYNHNDVAYSLLLQETYPSWLYPVKMGATTIWERWDGQKPDSTFQNPGMNSFNHYAYGAIGDWMYRVVGGIDLAAPGYKQISIKPAPDDRLSFARTSFESPYGVITSGWELKDNVMSVSVSIPANTTATITLPNAEAGSVKENKKTIQESKGLSNVRQDGTNVTFIAGSGQYVFDYVMK